MDERRLVAGDLHDEVIPSLFKVHLMGQVLRQDLNSGRLLDLDDDIPELIAATEGAQSAIRSLVRGLRSSSVGPRGLDASIGLLAEQLECAGSPKIQFDVSEVRGSETSELLIFQIVRESLNNAARHSKATRITVRLTRRGDFARVLVEDDGIGFDARLVDQDVHFGLQMLTERVRAGGGSVVVDSQLGRGTMILASVPLDC
jgi:signal transduction histidine kinase